MTPAVGATARDPTVGATVHTPALATTITASPRSSTITTVEIPIVMKVPVTRTNYNRSIEIR